MSYCVFIDRFGNYDLSHHGIKGMKWGKRNGPPYPLSYENLSPIEKRLASKSIENNTHFPKLTSDQTKRLLKIGAGVTIAAIAIGGTYYLVKSGKAEYFAELGAKYVNSIAGKSVSQSIKQGIGLSKSQINKQMVQRINASNANTVGGQMNCFHTTTSYILNSIFGKSTTALPFEDVDETSGIKGFGGRHYQLYNAIFDGLKIHDFPFKDRLFTLDKAFDTLKPGSTGVLHILYNGSGHYINYEKTISGAVTIIDPQNNIIVSGDRYGLLAFVKPVRAIDFSEAVIKEDAQEILKFIVRGFK